MPIKADDYIIIDPSTRKYSLGETTTDLLEVRSAGLFSTFKFGGAGFMKMVAYDLPGTGFEKGEFIEVRDTMLASIVSHGICKF